MKCPNCGSKVKDGASFCPNCGSKIKRTQSNDVVQIFRSGLNAKLYHNDSDCLVFPYIAESKMGEARANFNIGYDEKILWIRDTSFWNTVNQGMVITDKGVHAIWDNDDEENSSYFIDWASIERVWYQELVVHFQYQDVDVPISVSNIIKETDENVLASRGKYLALTFNQMANAIEPQASDFDICNQEIEQLCNANKYKEAAQRLQQCAIEQPEYATIWYEWLGRINFFIFKDDHNAVKAFQNALDTANTENTEWGANIKHSLCSVYFDMFKNGESVDYGYLRQLALYAATYGNDTENISNDQNNILTIKQDAKGDFDVIDELYIDEFLTKPYNNRKVLMPVKQYTELDQEIINVIDIQKLPKEIIFPMGHPIANQLYIGHPLLPHKYIPFENYQLELIEDKVREFCSIVQALGATEINIECLNSNSGDYSTNGKRHIEGNAGHKMINASGSYQNEYSRRLIEELNHSIQLHQTFTPSTAPSLPEDLIWYNNEPSWQRLYKQRMTGSLLSHEERIETRKSQMVESNEMTEIKGEVKTLFSSAGGSWTKNEELKYQIQENAVLSIKVTFASMNQLAGGNMQQTPQQAIPAVLMDITENEQEYIDEVKECLADGEIGGSERRLLNKLRAKLGISEERATELEAFLQKPQLTDEEQEYLEAYQDAMEDGVISEKERRLLDKLMKMNNISEQRAKEIEMLNKVSVD